RAWLSGFSSTLKTTAFAGGARYRPATSRVFSISSGSGETLNVSVRHRRRPDARPIRHTLEGQKAAPLPRPRLDQRGAPPGDPPRAPSPRVPPGPAGRGGRPPGRGSMVHPARPLPKNPRPPLADRLAVDAQPRRDRDVAAALRADQHDPRPQRQPLGG